MSLDRSSTPSRARPTMKDVATAAGVSLKTVSRVVNGDPSVNDEMRTAVQSAVAELGFRRNASARELRQGRSASIGLVLEDVADPFYSSLTRAVEEVAHAHGSLVFTASSAEDGDRERLLALAFCERRVDGLLIVPAGPRHSYLQPEIDSGIPVVFVDRPPAGLEADVVLSDNVGGARDATEHLIAHGHQRIGFIGDAPGIFTSGERLRGYRSALEAAGLPYDEGLVSQASPTAGAVTDAVRRFLSGLRPATALFCGNSRVTVRVLRELARRSDQPAVVGFDDIELGDLLSPGLTVVAQDPGALGAVAARLLFDRIAGLESGPVRTITLPTRFIARGSGELAPRDAASRRIPAAADGGLREGMVEG